MGHKVFTYWADGDEAFINKEGVCDCCKKNVSAYHVTNSKWWCGWNKYLGEHGKVSKEQETDTRGEYELHLCYECVASGLAAKTFQLKFNWVVNPSDECEAIGRVEVETKTPSYRMQNKDSWPVHCGEACVYLEGYGCDLDVICHDFQCRVCGKNISVYEHTDNYYTEP